MKRSNNKAKNNIQHSGIQKSQVIAHLALLSTAFFWGLSFISMKVILNTQIPTGGIFFLQETILPVQIIGGIIIIVTVFIVSRTK